MAEPPLAEFHLFCSNQLDTVVLAGMPPLCKSLGKKYGEVALTENHLLFGTVVHADEFS